MVLALINLFMKSSVPGYRAWFKKVGANPTTPSYCRVLIETERLTKRNLTLEALIEPLAFKLIMSLDRFPKTDPFYTVRLYIEVVALKVLEMRSANFIFGQAVQLIDGIQVHEALVSIISFSGDLFDPI